MEVHKQSQISKIEQRLTEISAEKESLLKEAAGIDTEYFSTYEIRPAGRHLLTIGEDLIQDQYAAIVELVKNSYDADSPEATISFQKKPDENTLEIRIEDHGHGMSTKDVINKWLVPSTDCKQNLRKSPQGRTMQGRKGIGRYAASILGNDFELITTDSAGTETKLFMQWDTLAKFQYLDQIRVPITTRSTNENAGTILIMSSRLDENDYWNETTFKKLRFELKKLVPPKNEKELEGSFKINLEFKSFFQDSSNDIKEEIRPYPILDLFDYRISGNITADGKCTLYYETQKIKNSSKEEIELEYGETGCGAIEIDIRVYDRDKESIDQLILRGLHDSQGNYVSKNQARALLNDVNGVGVYRNGFRIRPLGDADFDWLKLNEQRIQNPSLKIGSNQVVGYVHIESEEKSSLEEKSARDGLKTNPAYEALKKVTCLVIAELEKRRYIHRRRVGLSAPKQKIERQLEGLYDYEPLKNSVAKSLKKADIPIATINEIKDIISKEEAKKNAAIEEIKQAVAVYQGQATLGKIINIILHEGRRPLNYFRNQIQNLHFYGHKFESDRDDESYREIIKIANGLSQNSDVFVQLFEKLDPLSAKRRSTKNNFPLINALRGAISVFENEAIKKKVDIELNCSAGITFNGWKQDIYTIIVNLIDNSLFWINEKDCDFRNIKITVNETETGFILHCIDSGPGINNDLLESGVIFEPEFTTKPSGTGLGLAIAGEAATRNNLTLFATQEDTGAHFVLSTNEQEM